MPDSDSGAKIVFILQPAIFENDFDVRPTQFFHNFEPLFDSNKPYIHHQQNSAENYSKSTKIAIPACKFSKIFRESMPPDPPAAFPVSQSASN